MRRRKVTAGSHRTAVRDAGTAPGDDRQRWKCMKFTVLRMIFMAPLAVAAPTPEGPRLDRCSRLVHSTG